MKHKLISLNLKQIIQIVLPLAIVAIFTCFTFTLLVNNIIKRNIINVAEGLNEQADYEVRLQFEPIVYAINSLSENLKIDYDKDKIFSMLKNSADQYPNCEAFYFTTLNNIPSGGYIIMSDGWEAPDDFDFTKRPWHSEAIAKKGEIFYGEPYISASSGNLCIAFSKAVFNEYGKVKGVVGVDITVTRLSENVSNLKLSENTVVNIIDSNGLYLTNKDTEKLLTVNYFEDSKIKQTGYSFESYLDGRDKAFVKGENFFAVRKIKLTNWFAVIEGSVEDFTGSSKFWFKIIESATCLLILANIIFNSIHMTKTKQKENKISEQLLSETQNLVVTSKENAATAQDQSAAVKEIVATMEDNTALSEDISKKIKDVTSVANKTNDDVAEGVSYVGKNVMKLQEIATTNMNTINGIKALGDKISNIWDIVTLINSVADQAKIIAFNAELEASSAGEAGRNFHIVATEIRRLADGIIDGTKEIKEKITEIQQSSDKLIIASENGTEKIQEGVESAKNLEERFSSIKNASEITASSAGDITTIIQQQAIASEQILITLKQIAAGVENFTMATDYISNASQNLKQIASELSSNDNSNDNKKNEETNENNEAENA
ncbi:MAG: hypothetical protein K6F69_11205 [Treponema sp.]|nr:hypothetical protein [Treponema sp.]